LKNTRWSLYHLLILLFIFYSTISYSNTDILVLINNLDTSDIHNADDTITKIASFGNQAVDILLSRIDDPSRNISSRCIEILGKIGDKNAVEPLILKLDSLVGDFQCETFTTRFLRIVIINALGDLKDPKSFSILDKISLNGTDYDKVYSLIALVKIGDEKARMGLIACLKSENKNIRYLAVVNLGELQVIESSKMLIESIKDQEWFVRDAAAESLAKLEVTESIQTLKMLVDDPVPFVRKTAVKSLDILNKVKKNDINSISIKTDEK
jgi:HEAT repeat protein